MHSVPPTKTASLSPAAIESAPSVSAFKDDAHALLTVKAGTESGMPARWETCRAVFGPPPAWRACPKIVSSMAAAGSPERSIAARAATSPRSAAESDANEPPNLPIGVRTAESTKTGLMDGLSTAPFELEIPVDVLQVESEPIDAPRPSVPFEVQVVAPDERSGVPTGRVRQVMQRDPVAERVRLISLHPYPEVAGLMVHGFERSQPLPPSRNDLCRIPGRRLRSGQRLHVEFDAGRQRPRDLLPIPVAGSDEEIIDRVEDLLRFPEKAKLVVHVFLLISRAAIARSPSSLFLPRSRSPPFLCVRRRSTARSKGPGPIPRCTRGGRGRCGRSARIRRERPLRGSPRRCRRPRSSPRPASSEGGPGPILREAYSASSSRASCAGPAASGPDRRTR